MYLSLFNFTKVVIKSITITQTRDIYFRITNNTTCIFYKQLIQLPITGRFSKRGLLALNRLNNNRAIFKVRPLIRIQRMLCPGIVQYLILTGYISGLKYFT